MLSFWENGYLFYVAAAVCLLGVVTKWLASQRYKRLIKQADTPGNAKDKQMKLLRGRYDNAYRVMGNVPNPRVFVEKSLLEYRFLWTSLEKIDHLCRQIGFSMMLIGGAWIYLGVRVGVSVEMAREQLLGFVGLSLALLLWDLMLDTKAKKRHIITALSHYFENVSETRMGRLIQETAGSEATPEPSPVRNELEYLKQSLEHIAAGREEETETPPARRRFSPEEESVIKDIIREYLA